MKYITFLGVGGKSGYQTLSTYFEGEGEVVSKTNLVQSHIYKKFHDDINSVVVFLTKESKAKYFKDLSDQLEDAVIKTIEIDQNISSEEFVNHLIKELDSSESVILDVTHSFRKIPMRLLFALRYVEMMKDVQIQHVFYGEIENQDCDSKKQCCIIRDIAQDYRMQKVSEYLAQFDRTLIVRQEDWKDLLIQDEVVERFLESLVAFNQMTEFCNLDSASSVVKQIVECSQSIEKRTNNVSGKGAYTLLLPLTQRIRKKFESAAKKKNERDMLCDVIRVLLEHERYQIAITFTDELFSRELIHSIVDPSNNKFDLEKLKKKTHLEKFNNFTYRFSRYLKYQLYLIDNPPFKEDLMNRFERSMNNYWKNFEHINDICKNHAEDISEFSSKIRNSMNHASGVVADSGSGKRIEHIRSSVLKMLNIISEF